MMYDYKDNYFLCLQACTLKMLQPPPPTSPSLSTSCFVSGSTYCITSPVHTPAAAVTHTRPTMAKSRVNKASYVGWIFSIKSNIPLA